jgi:thioredoxin-like negative regulator of GroEL
LPKQFGVMSIPTMILFKDGNEVDRLTGAVSEEAVRDFASK